MKKQLFLTISAMMLIGTSVQAEKNPSVSMSTASYQYAVVKDKNGKMLKDKKGKPVKKWLKATKVIPGDTIKYIDTITNDSNEVIKDAKIANPINKNLIFVEGSASSKAKFSVTYSVDGGKSYDVPAKLFVIGKDKKKHPAQPKDYNAILFSVHEVPAQGKVDVSFKVKLK
jgi:uncharacterized repeat protein (TIGR01451 family)